LLPFMTPVFLQIGIGFSTLHAVMMMIQMVLCCMGMKLFVVQVVNSFGYRRVDVARTLGQADVILRVMFRPLAARYYKQTQVQY
ncbi:multidrug transporter subunit MdtD, partial [Klebsiella pneumoniae]|nr:multidrug transporter subunit MdtD [Klebsiella pneumoniae]